MTSDLEVIALNCVCIFLSSISFPTFQNVPWISVLSEAPFSAPLLVHGIKERGHLWFLCFDNQKQIQDFIEMIRCGE